MDDEAFAIAELVRACAFALTAAEFALNGQVDADSVLESIAIELDAAMRGIGCDIGDMARARARLGHAGDDN